MQMIIAFDPGQTPAYNDGVDWAGLTLATVFAFLDITIQTNAKDLILVLSFDQIIAIVGLNHRGVISPAPRHLRMVSTTIGAQHFLEICDFAIRSHPDPFLILQLEI